MAERLRVASWNLNGVRARAHHLRDLLRQENAPDVLLLQELKAAEDAFPALEVREAGYQALLVGQKGFNGVAVLSRREAAAGLRALPGDAADDQARWLEAEIGDLIVVSLYAPNGNPVGTDKFAYKLAWMRRLAARAEALFATERPVVLGGDWNVCPTARDVADAEAMASDSLCQPESRAAWHAVLWQGWTDAFRALHPDEPGYTYWDYQGGAWAQDRGLRIDHLLLSPRAAEALVASGVDRSPRAKDSPSDHTPVWCDLAL